MKLPSILIVDDDEAVLTVLKEMLTVVGYEVSATLFPDRVTSLIKNSEFDLLIYDLSVCGDQGSLEFLRSCLKYQPSLAILLITGFANDETRRLTAQLSIPMLEKPFEMRDLVAQLSAMKIVRVNIPQTTGH